MATETLTDHSATIRTQIETEVLALRRRIEDEGALIGDTWPVDDVTAQYVKIGYLINLHHGHPVFMEGDLAGGLPVHIDYAYSRTIRVCADNVRFVKKIKYGSEDTFYRDLSESVTW